MNSVAIGTSAQSNATGNVALGFNAQALSGNSLAIGQNAVTGAAVGDGVAVGFGASVQNFSNGTAVGASASTTGGFGTAIGSKAPWLKTTTALRLVTTRNRSTPLRVLNNEAGSIAIGNNR